jgi:hypothetical protein
MITTSNTILQNNEFCKISNVVEDIWYIVCIYHFPYFYYYTLRARCVLYVMYVWKQIRGLVAVVERGISILGVSIAVN